MSDTPNLHYDIWRIANAIDILSKAILEREPTSIDRELPKAPEPTEDHREVKVSKKHKKDVLKNALFERAMPKKVLWDIKQVQSIYQLSTPSSAVDQMGEIIRPDGTCALDDLWEKFLREGGR